MRARWLVWLAAAGAVAVLGAGVLAEGRSTLAVWSRRTAEAMLAPGQVHAKHADLACVACHRRPSAAGPSSGEAARGVPSGGPAAAGGKAEAAARLAGGARFTCLGSGCHAESDFDKPAILALHRRRADVPCQQCHPEHGGRAAVLTVAFHAAGADVLTGAADAGAPGAGGGSASPAGECADCHREEGDRAHPEIRVTRCALCHPSTRDWKETAFRHEDAAATACTECHRLPDDRLHGELSPAARGDCAACHGTERWKPAELSHAALAEGGRGRCDRCHGDEGRRAHPAIASTRCEVCHASTTDWKKISFSHAEVRGTACADCHRLPSGGLHAALAQGSRNRCESCHGTEGWRPARFSHDLAAGGGRSGCGNCHLQAGRRAHPALASNRCEKCHVSTGSWSRVNFSHAEVSGQTCAGCHRAPRNMIHAGTAGVSCSRCHTTRAWEPSTFRHPRVPEFGEHLEHVGCRGCHPSSLTQAVPCERCHRRGGFFEGD